MKSTDDVLRLVERMSLLHDVTFRKHLKQLQFRSLRKKWPALAIWHGRGPDLADWPSVMGSFYTNTSLLGPSRESVVNAFSEWARNAFVAPTYGDVTVVYDAVCEDQDYRVMRMLTERISHRFACPVVTTAVNDDDSLTLLAYDDGAPVFQFDSRMLWHRDVGRLCRSMRKPGSLVPVWGLLHLPAVVLESWRLARLAPLLGLPPWVASAGYNYLDNGESPPGVDRRELIHVPV
jgi:hypothetical protein